MPKLKFVGEREEGEGESENEVKKEREEERKDCDKERERNREYKSLENGERKQTKIEKGTKNQLWNNRVKQKHESQVDVLVGERERKTIRVSR